MTRSQDPKQDNNLKQIQILKWDKPSILTQEEAEARLHQEGYESFCWYDVTGAAYPRHKHSYDECLWILKGEIHFTIQEQVHELKSGDRIYLPAQTHHSSHVPHSSGVTYLVGRKRLPAQD